MDKRFIRYKRYAAGIRRLALMGAIWPTRVRSKLFQFIIFMEASANVFTLYGMLYMLSSFMGDFAKLTSVLGILIGTTTMLTKLLSFWVYRDRLIDMHTTLEKHFREDLENEKYRPTLLSLIDYFYIPTIALTLSVLATIFCFMVVPWITILTQRTRDGRVVQYRMPFPSKYPFPDNKLVFYVCYVIQLGASYSQCVLTTCTDSLWAYYVFLMASQIRVLSLRMQNLTTSDDHVTVMKECVLRRKTLAKCRDHLQTIYGPVVLWMLTGSALVTCANIFHLSEMSANQLLLSSPIFFYLIMKFIQIMLYGCCGLCLITESEDFIGAIYDSAWPGCGDKLFLSNIRTMLLCKPLVLKACQFYPITLDMVVAIINTALSYFFLLKTLDSD